MSHPRNAPTSPDAPPPGSGGREGDPRKRDEQDLRTAGRDDDREPDDPSRAPESGTP